MSGRAATVFFGDHVGDFAATIGVFHHLLPKPSLIMMHGQLRCESLVGLRVGKSQCQNPEFIAFHVPAGETRDHTRAHKLIRYSEGDSTSSTAYLGTYLPRHLTYSLQTCTVPLDADCTTPRTVHLHNPSPLCRRPDL